MLSNSFLRAGRGRAENGAVRAGLAFALFAVTLPGAWVAGAAQHPDRDRSGGALTTAHAPPAEERVDINHASTAELMKVPGMAPTWAARIVRFRPYRTKQDLLDKGVVTSEVYDRIKDYVIAHREKQ